MNADFSSDNFDEEPSDGFDEGNDSDPDALELSQTNLSQNKPRITGKSSEQKLQIETPQSSQTRVLLHRVTPTSTMATILDDGIDEVEEEMVEEVDVMDIRPEHHQVAGHGQHVNVEPETSSQRVSERDSCTPLSQQQRRLNRGLDLLPPRNPHLQGFEIGVQHSNEDEFQGSGTPTSAEGTRDYVHDHFTRRPAVSPFSPAVCH